ncbi:hypothetical protein V5799_025230 [Amblyomma americanum]|uniref:Uncharacterized protein n=1 Tax=Amblyomma americanum TaxID=6943 RepID=A0AAQ4E9T1_AMBAM
MRRTDGRPLLGPPQTAEVTTWSNVSSVQVRYEANIKDSIGTALLSWTCINGSVDYLQYKIADHGIWTTYDDLVDCDATVNAGRTQVRTCGNLRLTHQKLQSEFIVGVRCCNTYGCGREQNVRLNSYILGLLFNAENCEFFVSFYRDIDGQRYYSFPVQAVQE